MYYTLKYQLINDSCWMHIHYVCKCISKIKVIVILMRRGIKNTSGHADVRK